MKKTICTGFAAVFILSTVFSASATTILRYSFLTRMLNRYAPLYWTTFCRTIPRVVMDKKASQSSKKFTKKDFDSLSLADLQELSVYDQAEDNSLTNASSYRAILKLTLKEKGKSNVLKAVKKLEKHASVISAEPNYLVAPEEDLSSTVEDDDFTNNGTIDAPEVTPNDTHWASQYALTKLNAAAAWGMTTGSRSVKVGIIDSGIANHPDLNANLVAGWDFYNKNSITNDVTNYPHGTHIAGIIGAVGNNATGISGINWNVSLVPLQVVITDGTSNDGLFDGAAIISAIDYARTNNIPIINCSFGSLRSYFAYETVMRNYSGLIVCSAGNGKDHDNNKNTPDIPVDTDLESHDPSCTPLDNILSVASTNQNDALASTSNYGATSVDLAAPGVSIYSTIPGGSYGYMSGTSMAAPQVAGVGGR